MMRRIEIQSAVFCTITLYPHFFLKHLQNFQKKITIFTQVLNKLKLIHRLILQIHENVFKKMNLFQK